MAEICVIYLSEDEDVVGRLVTLLQKHWDVWWAHDLAHGAWEREVRNQIVKATAIVAVLSQHADVERTAILADEMRFAKKNGKPILPFLIEPTDIPFGFGGLNHTEAYGWNGEGNHPGYRQLKDKITTIIGHSRLSRPQELNIRGKILRLPAFVFSLSSHETQVLPQEGAPLLHYLESGATLISAYDAWKCLKNKDLNSSIKKIRKSKDLLFLDSGNYEAMRKDDLYSKEKKPDGWKREHYWETVARISPDLAFSFDTIHQVIEADRSAVKIIANFRKDDRMLRQKDFQLIPIIHLPRKCNPLPIPDCAAQICSAVARELDPPMLAIPERELGDGLLARAQTVQRIRKALNALGKYYPLHLLGTGNPLSLIALATAGADSFDGLEWCRTVADYEKG